MADSSASPPHKTRSPSQPNARYGHLFVVVRISKPVNPKEERPIAKDDVMLTKAFFSEDEALAEAVRLNEMNKDFWSYFVLVARLIDSA